MPEKRYKVILVEDGSTIIKGFVNPLNAAACMRNHKDYSVLSEKEWKVVRDFEAEQASESPTGQKGAK